MKFEALAETCELEIKQRNCEVDENLNIIKGNGYNYGNEIADKVEQVITAKLEEFNKTVNSADKEQFNNSGDDTTNNDNAGDSTGNNDSANSSAEQE